LWLVLGIKGYHIDHFGWAACRPFLDLRMPLGNLSGLNERIGHVRYEVLAADGESLRRNDIRTTDRIDLRTFTMKGPTAQGEIDEALGVIGVHVSEEDGIKLLGPNPELRQPHRCATACVELQFHGAAVVGIISVSDQRSS
jgi:hypothetical protein